MHTVQFSAIHFLGFLFSSERGNSAGATAPFAPHLSPFHTSIQHLCKEERGSPFSAVSNQPEIARNILDVK